MPRRESNICIPSFAVGDEAGRDVHLTCIGRKQNKDFATFYIGTADPGPPAGLVGTVWVVAGVASPNTAAADWAWREPRRAGWFHANLIVSSKINANDTCAHASHSSSVKARPWPRMVAAR
jgi:hypothetical protein